MTPTNQEPTEKPQLTVQALMDVLADSKRHANRRWLRKVMRTLLKRSTFHYITPPDFEHWLWRDLEKTVEYLAKLCQRNAHEIALAVAYTNAYACWHRILHQYRRAS